MHPRVVLTGMGTINPLGHNLWESWANLLNGVAGVGPVTRFDPSDLRIKVACEVKDFNPEAALDPKEARRRDRFEQFAYLAAKEALAQSGLEITPDSAERIGSIISSSGGGLGTVEESFMTLLERGPRAMNPFTTPKYMSSGAAGLTSIDFDLRGPAFSVESACASASDGIGIAWLMIRAGLVDAVVAGGSDASIVHMSVAALDRSGAMSHSAGPDSRAPRPFDLDRDGFVIGEGAGVLVLESEEFARRRGARILAELAGYGASADAFHITAPREDGAGAASAMKNALDIAGIEPAEVDHINSHGTGTRLNDVSETIAIKSVFGKRAYEIPVSATKSMTGHMMGTTASVEAIFTVQSILENTVPPTIHYDTPDPDCDLDYVPNEARRVEVETAISNAFGFAGHNSVLAFRSYR
ncbi:MAG: beta-ketoacyl-ACP synthase II [Anaerolineales bacterium]|nr:beta-ketoacyl-ACP synthase II [Anaerolineales bacterium]